MINLKSSFIAWILSGIAGGIFKILHYDTLFNIVSVINIVAVIFTIYFAVKKLRAVKP